MEGLLFVTGLAVGAAVCGLIVRFILKSRLELLWTGRVSELEGKARYTEGQADRLNAELARAGTEIEKLRIDLDAERKRSVEASARLDEAARNLEQQKDLIALMRSEMVETFKAHASSALETSNKNFLQLAQESLGKVVEQAKGKFGEHRAAMEGLINPLQEILHRYEEELKGIEKNRNESYGSLSQSIQSLSRMNDQLQRETSSLVTALRKPQVSGSWGQMSLKRAAELAGMAPYCDFYEQVSVESDGKRLRPDMVVRLPNGRSIVIDAKAPVDAYLNAVSAVTEDERKKALAGYIAQVRNHMNGLAQKSYWDQLDCTPEIVVMYLPGESFFSAALENDASLIEDGTMKKVILATPTTLIALLRAVAYGWQQEQVTKGAQEISRLGKELYERFATVFEHFGKVGNGLSKSVESYNQAVRSFETRLTPSLSRFKELGVSTPKEIEGCLEEVEHAVLNVKKIASE